MIGRLVTAVVLALVSSGNLATVGPLQDAARAGDVKQIMILLRQGADINDTAGLAPPIFYAIQNGHEKTALALIKLGADVNAESIWGTPLHTAASVNMPMAAAWLVGLGADQKLFGTR